MMRKAPLLFPALRVSRGPALFHPFFLLEKLLDAPKAAEARYTQNGGDRLIRRKVRARQAKYPRQKEHRENAFGKIIFRLSDNGVEQPDQKKRTKADENALHDITSLSIWNFIPAYYSTDHFDSLNDFFCIFNIINSDTGL